MAYSLCHAGKSFFLLDNLRKIAKRDCVTHGRHGLRSTLSSHPALGSIDESEFRGVEQRESAVLGEAN